MPCYAARDSPAGLTLPDILTISGSLRAASTNTALLAAIARNAPDGCRLTPYDGLGLLPIFNPDDEGGRTPAEATRLIEAVRRADGVIVSAPEYAHGVPGGLKNALDWLVSRDAAVGKPAMLVHASSRSAISRAALTEIMRTMSFDLHPGLGLEIALIGKKPPEVDAILAEPASIALMREALAAFAAFVCERTVGG
jgi:chromate reductase, NAD(P)H dehydrogenase (quinone)